MDELINWILEEGRNSDDLGAIFQGISERLVAQGIPLVRTNLGMPTIEPTAALLRFDMVARQGSGERRPLSRG